MRTGIIYALCDSQGTPYYVGRTVQSAGVRLGEHRREATTRGRGSACHLRTAELIEQGKGPAVWVLEQGIPLRALSGREYHWIGFGEGAGWELLNYTGGGNGATVLRADQREKCRKRSAKQPRDHWQRFLAPLPGLGESLDSGPLPF